MAPGVVIDGWRVGPPVECGVDVPSAECEEFLPVALEGLDRRDPGHLAVTSAVLHKQESPDGGRKLMVCSGGCPLVAVFVLVDGSVRAIGVGTPGISTEPMTFDYGSAR